jgi:hypothetical protein
VRLIVASLLQFLQADVGKAVLPKHWKGFFEHCLTAEISRARQTSIML